MKSLSKQERKIRKVRAKRQKSNAPKYSVQKSIWYELLFEKGLCQIDPQHFSKTYQLEEVNYQTGKSRGPNSYFYQNGRNVECFR